MMNESSERLQEVPYGKFVTSFSHENGVLIVTAGQLVSVKDNNWLTEAGHVILRQDSSTIRNIAVNEVNEGYETLDDFLEDIDPIHVRRTEIEEGDDILFQSRKDDITIYKLFTCVSYSPEKGGIINSSGELLITDKEITEGSIYNVLYEANLAFIDIEVGDYIHASWDSGDMKCWSIGKVALIENGVAFSSYYVPLASAGWDDEVSYIHYGRDGDMPELAEEMIENFIDEDDEDVERIDLEVGDDIAVYIVNQDALVSRIGTYRYYKDGAYYTQGGEMLLRKDEDATIFRY